MIGPTYQTTDEIAAPGLVNGSECGRPRDYLQNRFTYVVVSPRARGLSIGVNVNPDKRCNFNCVYCEVDRRQPGSPAELDLDTMAMELETTINLINSGALQKQARYARLAPDLTRLKHVALSGDGEPTISARFLEVVQTVVHLRARNRVPFFKLVLITNASGLDREEVQAGLRLFRKEDAVWAKLDGGTAEYLNAVNVPDTPLEKILSNILLTGRKRPIVIQSLFPKFERGETSAEEILAYAARLNELKEGGAQIALVQIYSATQPSASNQCGHLNLGKLVNIAQTVRKLTGLNAQVF
jgi:wyosine [tRNA(Phe)-imidazoG37] synthetase (radical SAM superfamily)